MYLLYIDHILFPVAPNKIVMETENGNKVTELVDGSYITRPGSRGLSKISFELLLPTSEYPFAFYEDGFKSSVYYTDQLRRIAAENEPVYFDVYRTLPDMNKIYLTNMEVILDKVSFVEDASNGMDMIAKIELTQYRNVETKIATQKRTASYAKRESDIVIPDTYTVKTGDTLWRISKKFFDDGSKYEYLARINSIASPYKIKVGQVIKLRG